MREKLINIGRKSKKAFLHQIDSKKKARVIHNLGIINYVKKDYKNAQIYFSKLFTEHSKNGLNSSGLYHLGDSFRLQKNTSAAKDTWELLIKTYPKSKFTKIKQCFNYLSKKQRVNK